MKFTVGMAVYSDPNCPTEEVRAKFTVMDLLIHHPLVGEVIVVDNNPHPHSQLPKVLGDERGRYVTMSAPVGTSPPRNKVFELANFDHVVCLDSHVVLYPGALESLAEFYYKLGETCPDLVHGPMMNEAGEIHATHMNDQWRSDMWGTWGRAWQTPDERFQFSTLSRDDRTVEYVSLGHDGPQSVYTPGELGLPASLSWHGHDEVLRKLGCTEPQWPYKIPGHGMGLFACRKDSWLPFHEKARGFGGEEMTTHYRYHQAGRGVWCVPGLKWWHDFGRAGGVRRAPYPLMLYHRVRNYILEFDRLGINLGWLREQFPEGRLSKSLWDQAVAGVEWPEGYDAEKAKVRQREQAQEAMSQARMNVSPMRAGVIRNVDEMLYVVSQSQKSAGYDLQTVRVLATGLGSVLQVGTGPGATGFATIALMAAKPKRLHVADMGEKSARAELLKHMTPRGTEYSYGGGMYTTTLDPTDQQHAYDLVYVDLADCAIDQIMGLAKGTKILALSPPLAAQIRMHPPTVEGFTKIDLPGENRILIYKRDGVTLPDLTVPPATPEVSVKPASAQRPQKADRPDLPKTGPGAELHDMIAALGQKPGKNCDCNAKAAQMNIWGVEGCRQNLETIVGFLRDNAKRWGWKEVIEGPEGEKRSLAQKITMAVKASATASMYMVKHRTKDPYRAFALEAIERADMKAKVTSGN